jgi:REP element-mobilizing transposase RayT
MITRRCVERLFLLVPSEIVNEIVAYALAFGQRKYGILLHTFCVMSNHLHLTLTDVLGNLPLFCRDVHAMIARLINARLGRKGQVFEAKQTHRLELDSETFVTWASYTLANPVSAGLVESHHEWPGLVSKTLTQKIAVKRPDWYFDAKTDFPAELELELTPPPLMAQTSVENLQLQLDAAVENRIRIKKEEMLLKKEDFAGREKVLEALPTMKATSPERIGARIPLVAIEDREKRIAWFKEWREWGRNYREAWMAWKSGQSDAVFPAGTWHVHVHLGAKRAVAAQA